MVGKRLRRAEGRVPMIEQLQYQAIVEKFLEKTKLGRVPWEDYESNEFRCDLDQYKFAVWKYQDGYGIRMEGERQRSLFSLRGDEEILYGDDAAEHTFQVLSDLYELARRKALNVPDKLAGATLLLDRI